MWCPQRSSQRSCELLSDFLSLFFEHNRWVGGVWIIELWIAFRFFIFVLRTQQNFADGKPAVRCELLSDFLSLFFEHNSLKPISNMNQVVNCFQIFYLCSSNTTPGEFGLLSGPLWIAFRFFIFVLRTQPTRFFCFQDGVVNCFQIFYLCSSNTTAPWLSSHPGRLWIAFRFFIFVLRTQQSLRKTKIAKHLWGLFQSKKVRKKSELFYF